MNSNRLGNEKKKKLIDRGQLILICSSRVLTKRDLKCMKQQ